MVGAHLIDEKQFLKTLAGHVEKSLKLETDLEVGGSHKGPPLHAAGALVAFTWDVTILDETAGKRGLGDFFRALWTQTEQGAKPYAWPDIRAAEPLPLARAFARVGVQFIMTADGEPRLTVDRTASPSAKSLWQALISGR